MVLFCLLEGLPFRVILAVAVTGQGACKFGREETDRLVVGLDKTDCRHRSHPRYRNQDVLRVLALLRKVAHHSRGLQAIREKAFVLVEPDLVGAEVRLCLPKMNPLPERCGHCKVGITRCCVDKVHQKAPEIAATLEAMLVHAKDMISGATYHCHRVFVLREQRRGEADLMRPNVLPTHDLAEVVQCRAAGSLRDVHVEDFGIRR
mmetsp:Transcript_25895/g.48625  ORF Transcript_25895/g.48625 Transcript_25895/m.48625 type:complete len:205 (+) Transcript_25895:225-839(+)